MLEIFKAGTHTDSRGVKRTYSDADIAQIAESYSPSIHTAPILVNHDESKPNKGVVQAVWKAGSRLFALPDRINPEFKEESKGYAGLSVALYDRNDPRNPTPGKLYLRHLAVVNIPSVKGMQKPEFSEENDIVIEFSEGVAWLEDSIPEPITEDLNKPIEDDMTVEREAALAAREAALIEREAAIANIQKQTLEASFTEFLNSSAVVAKLPVEERKSLLPILRTLSNDVNKVEFSEGVSLTPLEGFKKSILARPDLVTFGEFATEDKAVQNPSDLDPYQVAKLAQEYQFSESQKGNTVGIAEAVIHIQTNGAKK